MLVRPGKLVHVSHLGLCDFPGEYAAHTLPACMHVQHDLGCSFTIQAKKGLQHCNHEIHWREIIVEQDHLVQRGSRHLRPRLLDRQSVFPLAVGFSCLGHGSFGSVLPGPV